MLQEFELATWLALYYGNAAQHLAMLLFGDLLLILALPLIISLNSPCSNSVPCNLAMLDTLNSFNVAVGWCLGVDLPAGTGSLTNHSLNLPYSETLQCCSVGI
eukprot:scaffold272599_cov18-Tisochrysis_lutea.AAC.1